MQEFTSEELKKYGGKDDHPVYIAHQGKVYDVSGSKLWRTGLHMKRHSSGRDLTTDIQAAPHGIEVLERYPQVGVLKKEENTDTRVPPALARLLVRFPMLRRHPHPMTVHFPIVFMFSTTIFNILYLISGMRTFETSAFHCLGAGVFFTAVAIMTGFYAWWLNFLAVPVKAVTIKKCLASVMLLVAAIALVWRTVDPEVLVGLNGTGYIYLLLVLSVLPLVTVIGWYGAGLTFPVEKE